MAKKVKKRLHSRCFPTTFVNFFRVTILRALENTEDNNLVLSSNTCSSWLSIKMHKWKIYGFINKFRAKTLFR